LFFFKSHYSNQGQKRSAIEPSRWDQNYFLIVFIDDRTLSLIQTRKFSYFLIHVYCLPNSLLVKNYIHLHYFEFWLRSSLVRCQVPIHWLMTLLANTSY